MSQLRQRDNNIKKRAQCKHFIYIVWKMWHTFVLFFSCSSPILYTQYFNSTIYWHHWSTNIYKHIKCIFAMLNKIYKNCVNNKMCTVYTVCMCVCVWRSFSCHYYSIIPFLFSLTLPHLNCRIYSVCHMSVMATHMYAILLSFMWTLSAHNTLCTIMHAIIVNYIWFKFNISYSVFICISQYFIVLRLRCIKIVINGAIL